MHHVEKKLCQPNKFAIVHQWHFNIAFKHQQIWSLYRCCNDMIGINVIVSVLCVLSTNIGLIYTVKTTTSLCYLDIIMHCWCLVKSSISILECHVIYMEYKRLGVCLYLHDSEAALLVNQLDLLRCGVVHPARERTVVISPRSHAHVML